jgi:hypothetical protein
MYFKFNIVGFDREAVHKLAVVIRTLDKNGVELGTLFRGPFVTEQTKAILEMPGSTFFGGGSFALNRPGEFQLSISVIDDANNVKTNLTVPIRAYDP